jgi:hypothetical protein
LALFIEKISKKSLEEDFSAANCLKRQVGLHRNGALENGLCFAFFLCEDNGDYRENH